LGPGALPQAPFLWKKCFLGPGALPQAPYFVKNLFLVLERCRRRFFYKKTRF